jgi:hypothetical protein
LPVVFFGTVSALTRQQAAEAELFSIVLLLVCFPRFARSVVMKKLFLLGLAGLFSAVSVLEAQACHHRRCGGHHRRGGGCCYVQQYGGCYTNGAMGGYADPNMASGAAVDGAAGAAAEAPPAAAGTGANAGGRLP